MLICIYVDIFLMFSISDWFIFPGFKICTSIIEIDLYFQDWCYLQNWYFYFQDWFSFPVLILISSCALFCISSCVFKIDWLELRKLNFISKIEFPSLISVLFWLVDNIGFYLQKWFTYSKKKFAEWTVSVSKVIFVNVFLNSRWKMNCERKLKRPECKS